MVRLLNPVQFSKHMEPKDVTESGMTRSSSDVQPLNAYVPMELTFAPMCKVTSDVHP